jgi:hypothetical protein
LRAKATTKFETRKGHFVKLFLFLFFWKAIFKSIIKGLQSLINSIILDKRICIWIISYP